MFRSSISFKRSFSLVHWKTLNSLKTLLILDSFSRESNGEKVAPSNRSFAARVGGVFCKSKFKITVVSFLRLMNSEWNWIPRGRLTWKPQEISGMTTAFYYYLVFQAIFFFLSANLRLSIIVCSSNAEHFAWLAVRVVLIEVCTIGVFNLRSLRLWSCHCSLVHGRLRSSFKNRKDQISFHQKMELMKENFSFSSGTCFYAFNLKKEYS